MGYRQDWEGTNGDKSVSAGIENTMDDTLGTIGTKSTSDELLKPFEPMSNHNDSVFGEFTPIKDGGFSVSDIFGKDKMASTMQVIGSIAQAAAGIYDTHNRKSYQDKVFSMEESRINREKAKQDKQQAEYDKVFG